MKTIIPAILTNDFSKAQQQIEIFESFAAWIQIDIMDGTFVPKKSFDIDKMFGHSTSLNIEYHLMVAEPEQYIDACHNGGASRVYVHAESTDDLQGIIDRMSLFDFEKGVALNLETELAIIEQFISQLDAVLFMGVQPGSQGQNLDSRVLEKITEARKKYPTLTLGVDGGVNEETIQKLAAAGVDTLSVGSALSTAENPKEIFTKLSNLIA